MAHAWTIRFLDHRIADKRILRLIAKWLKVGTTEDGRVTRSERGTPQGAVISPILANVYLHYVYDLWTHRWRREATGDVIVTRYADDAIVGFQHEQEADAEAAAGGQDGVAQTNARPHCQDRGVVESDAQRVSELLCRFRKQPEPVVVLQRGAMALAQVAQAAQPACIYELGEVHLHLRTLLPVDQDTTPTAMSPLRRQNPREEPGALAAHAGIRAGGGWQQPSLP